MYAVPVLVNVFIYRYIIKYNDNYIHNIYNYISYLHTYAHLPCRTLRAAVRVGHAN